jgi:2-methylcitrate dehydratase PrpD
MAENIGITEEIARFIVGLRYEAFTPEVLHVAKRCMIDGIGVILAGSSEPCVQILIKHVLSIESKTESSLLGKGKKTKVPIRSAALLNGAAGHAMDWDDTAISKAPDRGVLLHPTVPPLAASLAVGENLGVSGQALVTAFVAGFEVECKLAEAISADHRSRGFHTSGTCGIFGAAAAASKLMDLSVDKVRTVLGIAASMASGLDVNLGTMVKPLHVGRASENGVVAAQLAALGYDASPNALEGYKGFFQAFGSGFDANKISGKLGRPFSIIEPGVSVKPYPCGVVGHSTMDAMHRLVTEHKIKPEDVDHVKVTTGSNILPPKGPLRYRKAQTALQAKFCVPFQMAVMIIRGKAGMTEFDDAFVQTPAVQEMMDRVETSVDPEFDRAGQNRYVSTIAMRLKNGRLLEGKSPDHPPGSPQRPLSREALAGKFMDCVQCVLSPAEADALLKTIEGLDELGDIRILIDRVCPQEGPL